MTDPKSDECKEWFEDIWRTIVYDGDTNMGLEEWIEHVLRYDGDEAIFDISWCEHWDKLRALGLDEEEYPIFEAVGCGRIFHKDDEYDEIYNKEALDIIARAEGW